MVVCLNRSEGGVVVWLLDSRSLGNVIIHILGGRMIVCVVVRSFLLRYSIS